MTCPKNIDKVKVGGIVAFSIFRQLIFNHAQSFRAGQQIEKALGIGGLGVLRYNGLPVLRGADTVTHDGSNYRGTVTGTARRSSKNYSS